MGEIRSYKVLKVWQKGIDLVVDVYELFKKLPNEEHFGLISQLKRASVSAPINIVEGFGRQAGKNFSQILKPSRRSQYEVELLGVIAQRLETSTSDDYRLIDVAIEHVKNAQFPRPVYCVTTTSDL